MERWLTILEVSQKQAYIFSSNKVADNIVNSAVIAKCLSPQYIKETLAGCYDEEKNMVYSGGGHTILEFGSREEAADCTFKLSKKIFTDFEGLSVYAKSIRYDESLGPNAPKENLKKLTAELEKKKALRTADFHKGTFGIEKIDINTNKPIVVFDGENKKEAIRKEEDETTKSKFTPDGFIPTKEFEKLGGSKNEKNLIAVVHIDGNGMGKRVEELYDHLATSDWETTKKKLREFSECIDKDFKDAYKEMTEEVALSLKEGSLKDRLDIKTDRQTSRPYFPIRRIITAGDDICFVTEGRIGIDSSRIFIEKLANKKNSVDLKGYTACAGIAIVHQKFPFYKAYELAESLCSNAKKEGAKISQDDNGRNVNAIDWHIELGELKDGIEEIRSDYIAEDGTPLTKRPYIISANEEVMVNLGKGKKYDDFLSNMRRINSEQKEIGDGIMKQLRGQLKKGKIATDNFLSFHQIDKDNGIIAKEAALAFDAIEMMDSFLIIE